MADDRIGEKWPGFVTLGRQIKTYLIMQYPKLFYFLPRRLVVQLYEYIGDNYEADMQKMANDPKTQRWWQLTDPCQEPMPRTVRGDWWSEMEEVFHTD